MSSYRWGINYSSNTLQQITLLTVFFQERKGLYTSSQLRTQMFLSLGCCLCVCLKTVRIFTALYLYVMPVDPKVMKCCFVIETDFRPQFFIFCTVFTKISRHTTLLTCVMQQYWQSIRPESKVFSHNSLWYIQLRASLTFWLPWTLQISQLDVMCYVHSYLVGLNSSP
jgi:hypothetical protein